MSAGNGECQACSRWVSGWVSPRDAACSAWRGKVRSYAASAGEQPFGRRLRPPYTGSPTIGKPVWARCTRIWCVRPVSSVTRTSVWARKRLSMR